MEEEKNIPENSVAPTDALPDWLVESVKPVEENKKTEAKEEKSTPKEKKENKNPAKIIKEEKKEKTKKDEQSPVADTSSLPDWLK